MKKVFCSQLLPVCAALLVLFSTFTIFAQNDDDEVLKIDSSLVVLNAAVSDAKGVPVLGLKQKHFKVFEDGVEQKIDFFAAEEAPFAAVILIDTSGSMEQRLSMARSAAINFLDGLREDDMAAIYNFDSEVKLVQEFSQSTDIAPATFDIKARGSTALYDAIFKAAEELVNRPEKRKAIIVLSDGADNKSTHTSGGALKAALAAGATIYTVDMASMEVGGSQVMDRMKNAVTLKALAEKSGGRFIAADGASAESRNAGSGLRNAFVSVLKELGNQYTITYQPSNTAHDGKYRKIEVKVTTPTAAKTEVRTRKGYNALKK